MYGGNLMNCSGGGGVDYDMWLRQVREYDIVFHNSDFARIWKFFNYL
jgi:hypothetical protein